MTWQFLWTNLFKWVFDAFMVLWFFVPLKSRRRLEPPAKILCFLILLCTFPIYVSTGSSTLLALGRLFYRAAIYALWLRAAKGTSFKESTYYSLLCWVAFTTQNNIFLTPQLSFLRWNQMNWTQITLLNQIISLVIEIAAEFIIITVISKSFPFGDDKPSWRFRFISVAVVILCQLYVKVSLRAMTEALPERYMSELTLYPILLQLLLTAALILLERHLYARRKLEQATLEEVASRYRYEMSQAKAKADTDIRQLHHDMKNHLLGIRRLSSNNEKLEQYISGLLDRTEGYEMLADTGNTMIDGLLSEKMRKASEEGIDIAAAVDLRNTGRISDMDLCTIFGNALDNAIEASVKVSDKSLRSIMVKGIQRGGELILTVQNFYEGQLNRAAEGILTSKSEPGHGLGLSSIRRAVENNGGIMTTSTDEYHNFILTILIPLEE
ncbi:MAG: sensor histidine kinase [Firmicutes bacterium]|nr:sensor histidine kinase [Bacillota bacterium]